MTFYLVIIKNKDGGYATQLRSRPAATIPDMQSRRQKGYSQAVRDAERIFGSLRWMDPVAFGITNQPYVVAMAMVNVTEG